MSKIAYQSSALPAQTLGPIFVAVREQASTKRLLRRARKHVAAIKRKRDLALAEGNSRKAKRLARLWVRSYDGRLIETADEIRDNERKRRAQVQNEQTIAQAPAMCLGLTAVALKKDEAARKSGGIRPNEMLIGDKIVELARGGTRNRGRVRPMSLRDAGPIASAIHLGRAPRAKYTIFPVKKSEGTFRPMHAFGVADRAKQKLFVRAYGPLLARDDRNYAAPGMGGRAAALEAILKAIADQKAHKWAATLDIKNCFPSVDREWLKAHLPVPKAFTTSTILMEDEKEREGRLMSAADGGITRTRARIKCSGITHMGISHNASHLWITSRIGLPQGAATSSAVATHIIAIVLRSVELPEGVLLVIYADDMLVLGATRADVEKATETLRGAFKSHPAGPFVMHDAKPKTVAAGFSFLGMKFKRVKGEVRCEPDEGALRHARHRLCRAALAVEQREMCALAFGRLVEGVIASMGIEARAFGLPHLA